MLQLKPGENNILTLSEELVHTVQKSIYGKEDGSCESEL